MNICICPIENVSRQQPYKMVEGSVQGWLSQTLLAGSSAHDNETSSSIKCSLAERLLHRFSRSKPLHDLLPSTILLGSTTSLTTEHRWTRVKFNTSQVFNLAHIGECLWICPSSGDGNKRRTPFPSSSPHIFAGNSRHLSHFSATPDKWQLWRYMRCTMPQHYTVNARVKWTELWWFMSLALFSLMSAYPFSGN